jgi:hypothetical protein
MLRFSYLAVTLMIGFSPLGANPLPLTSPDRSPVSSAQ